MIFCLFILLFCSFVSPNKLPAKKLTPLLWVLKEAILRSEAILPIICLMPGSFGVA